MTAQDAESVARTHGPVVILVEPQLGENIGMTARAMANFGLTRLRLVNPRDGWPSESAEKAASGADWIIRDATVHSSLEDAIADLGQVYATTARPRDIVKPVLGPDAAATEIIHHSKIADQPLSGVLFGRERWGLTNDEVALADSILTYEVNPDFASLNISQAVLLFGHVWFAKTSGPTRRDGFEALQPHAVKADLMRLFEHLESELDESGFLRPLEKRPRMVNNLRAILTRAQLTEGEVRTLRGVIVSLVGRRHRRNERGEGERRV